MARDQSDFDRPEKDDLGSNDGPQPGPDGVLDSSRAGAKGEADELPLRRVDRTLLEALVCPVRRTTLLYDAEHQELISPAADLAYPIEDGVPILVPQFARPLTDADRTRHRIR